MANQVKDNHRKKGPIINIDDEVFYRIENVTSIKPFLMTLASSDDHWMFLSSTGGLTAGRKNEHNALFPYETVDKLHRSLIHTGPVTIIQKTNSGKKVQNWQPFNPCFQSPDVTRNLYKNGLGTSVIFEEINDDLQLSFSYRWSVSSQFGFVRTSILKNIHQEHAGSVRILDGLRNILPWGIETRTQESMSNLADAYKQSEYLSDTGMAIFSLTSLMMDRPEPGECLKATTVWHTGIQPEGVTLSENDIDRFTRCKDITNAHLVTGDRGAYLVYSDFTVPPGRVETWSIVADVNLDQTKVSSLANTLSSRDPDHSLSGLLQNDIILTRDDLEKLVCSADGYQMSQNQVISMHHSANVMFNIMRGGTFLEGYIIRLDDFRSFMQSSDLPLAKKLDSKLPDGTEKMEYFQLMNIARSSGNPSLIRWTFEYLPLIFSRRHGDPSRPWNKFDIQLKNPDGSRGMNYEGNWRDIFQNWDALMISCPEYIESVIAKFVNASTIDGNNPFRISRKGIDWEVIDDDNPWAFIGYWGDHQINYLYRFLQTSSDYHPDRLDRMLEDDVFSYANIPYRIKKFSDIISNPKTTINFDSVLHHSIIDQSKIRGSDAKLLLQADGSVYHVNLLEKLLVSVLAKLSNLVVGGGIWMNTQRPEWNDANNALTGYGLSMVTLCYLHRYIEVLLSILDKSSTQSFQISSEVIQWMRRIRSCLNFDRNFQPADLDSGQRFNILYELGSSYSEYRWKVYSSGFSGRKMIQKSEVSEFLKPVNTLLAKDIRDNQRPDGLYHTYNLIAVDNVRRTAEIQRLYEMLEGQVAVLSSGVLSPDESSNLLRSLFDSRIYNQQEQSFMLYPQRELPAFLEKNQITETTVYGKNLDKLYSDIGGSDILSRDLNGQFRFNHRIINAKVLEESINEFEVRHGWKISDNNRKLLSLLYEDVFKHHSFTGRSGTMYAYEGIGSIYWHMVAKLLVAVQENYFRCKTETLKQIFAEYYRRIRQGLGYHKTAEKYGAFPFDPYSHTPWNSGAKQPGMTGQVKEEIITRFGELGIHVMNGKIRFRPELMDKNEFLGHDSSFTYYTMGGIRNSITLDSGSMAFTYCQTPVIYHLVMHDPGIKVKFFDGRIQHFSGCELDPELSGSIHKRQGLVTEILVDIPEGQLLF